MERRAAVLLHGLYAGELAEDDTGQTSFRLSKSYRDAAPRPVLSQSFEDDLERVYRGKRGELPAFFANLVPEGALRDLVEESLGIERGDDFALLTAVGGDLPGAVEVRKAEPSGDEPKQLGVPVADGGEEPQEETTTRFSLAGVQLKFSVLRQADKIVIPTKGRHGQWIAKLDSPSFQEAVENEFAMLEWARAAGFAVPECHLLPATALEGIPRRYASAGKKLLLIKRYDRRDDERIHQEDFCQVVQQPPRLRFELRTYEQLAVLVRNIVGETAYDEFVRRLTFVIASGNSDAHLKNWSLIYPDRISAQLAPVYDQVSTVAWPWVDRKLALKLAGVKDFGRIDSAAVERFAEKSGDDPSRVIELVDNTIANLAAAWQASSARPPMLHLAALREHWRRVLFSGSPASPSEQCCRDPRPATRVTGSRGCRPAHCHSL